MSLKPSKSVSEKVAGRKEVELAFLRRRVGRVAIDVWQILIKKRSFEGYSWLSGAGIVRQLAFGRPLSDEGKLHVVKRAVQCLSRVGLVEPSCRAAVEFNGRKAWLHVRMVYGRLGREGFATIPIPVFAQLQKAGRGLRKGSQKAAPRAGISTLETGTQKAAPRAGISVQIPAPPTPQIPAPQVVDLRSKREKESFLLRRKDPAPGGAGISLSSKGNGSEPSIPKPPPPKPQSLDLTDEELAAKGWTKEPIGWRHPQHGYSMSRPGRPAPKPAQGLIPVPPLTIQDLNPASIPSPPLLDVGTPEEDTLLTMVRAYRGAVKSRFGDQPAWRTQDTQLVDSSSASGHRADYLLEAARMLQERFISPFGWSAFSCDVWKNGDEGKRRSEPPPIDWVYSLDRIDERSGWFNAEASDYTGKRVVFSKSASELIRAYEKMRMDMTDAKSREDQAAILDRHFPPGTLDALLEKARAEADADRDRIASAVREGEWLWG